MFVTPKSLVMFVLAPTCLPISQIFNIDLVMNIIGPSTHGFDFGVSMSRKKKVSVFYRERKILMRKRTKLWVTYFGLFSCI